MSAYINVAFANVYRQPTFHSEIDSQVVLGELVSILNQDGNFIQIRCEDNYQGWIHKLQVSESTRLAGMKQQLITADVCRIYSQADVEAPILGMAYAGSYIYVLEPGKDWLKILVPDEMEAWIRPGEIAAMPSYSAENMIAYTKRFMGVPYFWGGKTFCGLDCSGFTQLVHKMFGFSINRDAWMQARDSKTVGTNPMEGIPGQLMFFSESGSKITHVGFCLGNGKLLHARGRVRINSLRETDADFDPSLKKDFVELGTLTE